MKHFLNIFSREVSNLRDKWGNENIFNYLLKNVLYSKAAIFNVIQLGKNFVKNCLIQSAPRKIISHFSYPLWQVPEMNKMKLNEKYGAKE